MGDAATARASACAPTLFSYPSPDVRRLPLNAVFFIVPDGRAFFDPAPVLFTSGLHVMELELE
jgi:hypothetical protein